MSYTVNPRFVRYGTAAKASFQMSKAEFQEASESIMRSVREKAFAKGLPIYYAINHNIIAEYADGRKEVVKKLSHATKPSRSRRPKRNW